ncbi:TPA: hypothetical protein L1198_004574 [Escherichia coli]|nr:hypothetical protein [Escherichia coli]
MVVFLSFSFRRQQAQETHPGWGLTAAHQQQVVPPLPVQAECQSLFYRRQVVVK